jgi:hypothetical protein
MSFGNKLPIREQLLEDAYPLLEELKGSQILIEYDIQLRSWEQQGQYLNAWALICICKGALLGDENNISFVWTFGVHPQPPNQATLRASIRDMFTRIGMMRMKQLQQGPAQGNAN